MRFEPMSSRSLLPFSRLHFRKWWAGIETSAGACSSQAELMQRAALYYSGHRHTRRIDVAGYAPQQQLQSAKMAATNTDQWSLAIDTSPFSFLYKKHSCVVVIYCAIPTRCIYIQPTPQWGCLLYIHCSITCSHYLHFFTESNYTLNRVEKWTIFIVL